MKKLLFILTGLLLFASCSESSEKNTQKLIEDNVRAYFFMGDSIDIQVQIVDTIKLEDLKNMQDNTTKNENLTLDDMDTLQQLIQNWQDKYFELTDNGANEIEIQNAKIMSQQYEITYLEVKLKHLVFQQSNRIFLNLERNANGNIAGFEGEVQYTYKGKSNIINVLMDSEYRVVD